MVTYADIYIDSGADYSSIINLFTLSYEEYELFGQVRKSYTVPHILDLEFEPVEHFPNKAEITVASTQTISLKGGRYYYDIFVRNKINGRVQKIREGQAIISPSITDIIN